MEELPEEVLVGVLMPLLAPSDVLRVGMANSFFRRMSIDEQLWRQICYRDYPQLSRCGTEILGSIKQDWSWYRLFRKLNSNIDFRLSNGIFSQYLINSKNYQYPSQHSIETLANSENFRAFYPPPSKKDSSLFVRVLANYRRWRVENWRTDTTLMNDSFCGSNSSYTRTVCAGALPGAQEVDNFESNRVLTVAPSIDLRFV